MAAPLRIQLTPEEDRLLLELSLDPKTHKKTRLWAMMVRLAAEGWTAPKIAQHFHKDRTTVYLVLRRFLREGLQGLVYCKPPGAPRKFTPEMAAFVEERLAEDRVWTASQLSAAIAERFGVRLAPKVVARHLRAMGYVWRRTRYVPRGRPEAEEVEAFVEEEEEAKKGAQEGVMEVGYLDESGFALTLPPTYAWCRRGEAKGVPRAWGKEGRVNVVGHLVRGQEGERLFFALLEGPVRWEVLRGYLDRVAESLGKPLKVFMVAYLPRYSPHLNPMEGVWRRVKGFLMPRRHYGSVEELKEAVVQALEALGGVELKILGEGT
ncbi:IS630 family transposase [Thermus thermophilus]|nr:IS630 family transposase [Thermus thermophilus]